MLSEIKEEFVWVLLVVSILAAVVVGTCIKPFDTQLTWEELELEAE